MESRKRLSILITNDDGIEAPGINVLAGELSSFHDVTVVSPSMERSGYSAAITLQKSIAYEQIAPNRYRVEGTPADAAHMGIRHFMKEKKPDLVVSGINRGPNLGNDTIFSGTVGAANCACLDGIPAMAVSMGCFTEPQRYDTAAKVVAALIQTKGFLGAMAGRVLNVNVPNKAHEDLAGIRETNLGLRVYPNHFDRCMENPDSALRYAGGDIDNIGDEDTDVRAIEKGQVSLTFLRPFLQDGTVKLESLGWQLPRLEDLMA